MKISFFDPVLFAIDGDEVPLDTAASPYLFNYQGHTYNVREPQGTLIELSPERPDVSMGRRYEAIEIGTGPYDAIEFDFRADPVTYEPLWATKETAQAFGMTLLQSGESIRFVYSELVKAQYTYSVFAGHQSPYLGSSRSRELLSVNATDLEYHGFAHVFQSQDQFPLVISVGRWRQEKQSIWLADLWVRPGDCLVVPPKTFSPQYVDMHNNRNSAFACWGALDKNSLVTETILGNAEAFSDPATKPHYHEEKHPTVHLFPDGFTNR